MALIIEDGTAVAGAQSFATAAELTAYADLRGITYPATVAEQEQLLIKAMDYLFSRESELKGSRVSESQTLVYPRSGVHIYEFSLSTSTIPEQIKSAQIEAALFENTSALLSNATYQNISANKVGPLNRSYFNGGNWTIVRADRVNAHLSELLQGGGTLRIVRV